MLITRNGIWFPHKSFMALSTLVLDLKQKETYITLLTLTDPSLSTERPPLVETKQEGKNSIYTTNFYCTNKSPSNIVIPSPSQNKTTPTGDKAAAADPTIFDSDLLQPDEICLHSWMLCTSQAPILDLTGKDIKSMTDIEHAFHALNLCPKENSEKTPNGREETRGTNKFK